MWWQTSLFLVNLESTKTMATRTVASFPTQGLDSPQMQGEYNESQVRALFSTQVSNITNMTATRTEITDADGKVVTYTFVPKVGNKG